MAGKPKGTEYVLAEHGLLSAVEAVTKSRGGKVVGTCEVCRASEAERERVTREVQSRQAEFKGLEPAYNGCSPFEMTSRVRSNCALNPIELV